MARLPEDISRFIDVCIPSIEQLEVLLWLRQRGRGTASEVARILATSSRSVSRGFDHLIEAGLVHPDRDGVRYAAPPPLDQVIERLAAEYAHRRLQVIDHLYGRTSRTGYPTDSGRSDAR
jgi:DNA-binding IclR family transcriptional regulator